jgi:uncharacterized protein (DUF1499 family)
MADAQPNWLIQNNPRIAAAGATVAALGALVAMLSGPLYQAQVLDLTTGFSALRWGAQGAAVGAAVSAVSLVISLFVHKGAAFGRNSVALVGLLIGALAAYVPTTAQGTYPPIHDVTTDIDNPPQLVDAIPLRDAHPFKNRDGKVNPAEYIRDYPRPGPNGGTLNVPELQQKAFPDIQPVKLDVPPAAAFEKALATVKALKWTVITAKPEEGRIEAWDKTAWFGFVDDVVIRVQADGAGSRIDIRSVSRIGFGDVGKNGKRIRGYVKKLTGKGGHGG